MIQFLRFVLAAGASVPFNVGSRVLFSFAVPFEIAVILSHCVGMAVAYTLTRAFVFQSTRQRRSDEMTRFAVVNLISVAQTWLVAVALLRLAAFPELVAHLGGLATSSVTSFFGHRHFSFREKSTRTTG